MKNNSKIHILIVEDNESLSIVYRSYLEKQDYSVYVVDTGEDALDYLSSNIPDVVLLDLQLPDMHGTDILKEISEQQLPCEVVIITAHGSLDLAVETMRLGATDFLTKPFDANRLIVTVENVLKHKRLNQMVETYQENFSREHFHGFIGASLSMQSVYRMIESSAKSKASVFIIGESGTGKELCAEALHKESNRKKNAFIPLNCAAIPKDLMESEIFGHAKGAFTGAVKDREGAASQARNGTLFLDEICEMDLELQSKLLRFIQTGTFQKVGSSKIEEGDIRFVSATNRDPLEEVKAGRFREDLYYRLHVIPIELPPLRERDNDVIKIAREFLSSYSQEEGKSFTSFSLEAEQMILEYDWPGNIRQLQNVIRNIVVLNQANIVTPEMLPPPLNKIKIQPINNYSIVSEVPGKTSTQQSNEIIPLWKVEQKVINEAIVLCDGNIPQAAARLEVSPSTIYRKKQSWEDSGL